MEFFRPHNVDPIQDVEGTVELLADERLRVDFSVKVKQGRESDQGRGLALELHAPYAVALRGEVGIELEAKAEEPNAGTFMALNASDFDSTESQVVGIDAGE